MRYHHKGGKAYTPLDSIRDPKVPCLSQILRPLPEYEVDQSSTAMMIIDMTLYATDRNSGLGASLRRKGIFDEFRYYFDECDRIIPNIRKVMEACRRKGIEVIHVNSEDRTLDSRDTSHEFMKMGILIPKGSESSQIHPELAPLEDEMLFSKDVSGVFNGTHIDHVLKRMGIHTLMIAGVVTNQCVECAVRDASNLDYDVILLSDGTATYSRKWQDLALEVLSDQYANVTTTEQVLHGDPEGCAGTGAEGRETGEVRSQARCPSRRSRRR